MRVQVGRIGRAHGVRGDVAVEVRTDDPERRFRADAQLFTDEAGSRFLSIAGHRWHSGRLLVSFHGCGDRTAAEALAGTPLFAEVDPDQLPDDPQEWYDHQLVGLEAVLASGAVIGTVGQVLHLPGQDLLEIDRNEGSPVLVPFVTAIVPEVDLPGRRLTIAPPPGLLDPTGEEG